MSEQNNGGPAFPFVDSASPLEHPGMSLRDYFATNAPSDTVQELSLRHLSRQAQEQLTGLNCPERPHPYKPNNPDEIKFQLAELEFQCAVDAAIRFKLADAMLEARKA